MIVCIAEKPSVAKDIARVLGANHSQNGYMEGNGYQVTWTFGHLCELKSPDEYTDSWKRWTLASLPMIPNKFAIRLKEDEGIKKQFEIIKKLFADADEIVNCGDAGQEGELIQRWVMQKAGVKCQVKRLWISSMTDEAIREGFKNLKPQEEYHNLYMAGLSRAIGDWLLGMNCTRLYTLKYGQNRPYAQTNGIVQKSQPLSIGRVQTPTLALIVKRQLEIEKFVPEPYWVLSTLYRNVSFQATKGKFKTKDEGVKALEDVINEEFYIKAVNEKNGTEAPPRLYDLTALQVDCNKKFGFSADLTLNIIQSLYEKKYTTYPRVDTTFLSDDVYKQCPVTLKGLRGYEAFTKPLEATKLVKRKKVFDSSKVTDHHAIIPTGQPAMNLTDMERKVYDLVARAFIAVFYPDCKFKSTVVLGNAGPVEFKATGKVITSPGWRAVYPKNQDNDNNETNEQDNKSADQKEQTLPEFTIGEHGPHKPELLEKQTQPPSYYTEATLLRAMETAGKTVDNEELRDALKENGIGRPSTRAAIIETLFKRKYIKRVKKRIEATITGVELIQLIHEELLKSAELTGIWEKKLREIDKGNYNPKLFIDELKQMVNSIVYAVLSDNSNRRVSVEPEKKDNKTSRKKGTTKEGKKDNPSSASTTLGHSANDTNPATNSQPRQVVAGFQPKKMKTSAKSQKANVGSNVESNNNVNNKDEWIGLPCPVCGQGFIVKGKTAYGCSRWKEGCTYRYPFNK